MAIKTTFLHTDFNKIANNILNNTLLMVNGTKFRICEIEFYYTNDKHNDQYTHCSSDQAKFGFFYFHQYKNGTYKSGTYKGMDMTFGNNELYCGVLIRSLYDIDNDEFIEGPCRSVNKILELNGFTTVADFMDGKKEIKIYDKNDYLYLKPTKLNTEDIYCGKRVGLSNKYPDFLDRKYRYATMIKKIKKQKQFEKVDAEPTPKKIEK